MTQSADSSPSTYYYDACHCSGTPLGGPRKVTAAATVLVVCVIASSQRAANRFPVLGKAG
jgi:hypothetical protein